MKPKTSWQKVSPWYKKITQDKGHYYHEHVVIPGVLKLLDPKPGDALIDVACGTGVLGRVIKTKYLGIDIAPGLIAEAKKLDKNPEHRYMVKDVLGGLEGLDGKQKFSHATCILALQNIEKFQLVFENVARVLEKNGTFVIVLNHPAFRIPRQSSWGIDEQNKLQFRKVNRYLSPLKIPITAHPGQKQSPVTWSFHQPLSTYINGLTTAGFVVTHMEEWSSDKESEGKMGKMENRARAEIPLFMTIVARNV